MARRGSTGVIKAWFVPVIVDMNAPKTTEIAAGTDLTGFITRDGINTPVSASNVDTSDISDRRNKRAPGSYGGDDWALSLYRDDVAGNDGAWSLLVRDLDGFLVIRRFGGSDVPIAVGDEVEITELTVNSRQMAPTGDNTSQMFTANLATARQVDSATVVL